jgi:hypothetical protein
MQTKTSSGVTCTANGDGTYTLNGTATSDILFPLQTAIDTLELPKTYRLVGCPSGGTGSTFELNTVKIKDGVRTVYASDYGNGATKEYESGAKYEIRIRMAENTTFNNVTFKPMLTTDLSVTYDDFVQYSGDGELNENVAELYEGLESTDANLADVQSQIVTSGNIESGNTATSAHTVGTYIQWKGKFYVVTSAIAVGDTLAVGTNLATKTVGEVLTQINADLSDKEVKSVLLTSSVSCRTLDDLTIGYKTTGNESIDIRNITGYPSGKTILGYSVEFAYLHQNPVNILCFINIVGSAIYAN